MVLVTGGAGFIGSHIVEQLAASGVPVRVLDFRPPARVPDGVEIRVGDVRDADAVADALQGVTAVCHQAAKVGLGVDVGDLPDYASHNDLGTAVLLRAVAHAGTVERIVLASSMVIYGEGRYDCPADGPVRTPPRAREDLVAGRYEPRCPHCGGPLRPQPVTEEAPPDPRNVYAATKLHQEHLALALGRETGIAVTALRYHNAYGPRMPRDTPYAGVAALFASELRAGRAPRVFEDGGQLRDFVHVRDVARANVLALLAPAAIAGAFNVCSGTPRSVLDLARALQVSFPGAPAPHVVGGYRLGDVRHVFASPRRAREVLGFVARERFADGIAELAGQATAA